MGDFDQAVFVPLGGTNAHNPMMEPTEDVLPRNDFQNMQGVQAFERQREEALIRKHIEAEKGYLIKLYLSQSAIALAAGLLVAIFCYAINPPLTQKSSDDPFMMENQSIGKVLIFVAVVVVLTFLVPELARLFGF
jgi:hypothetical protein